MFNNNNDPTAPPAQRMGRVTSSAYLVYDPETEGDVYRVVPVHPPESVSEIVSETTSASSEMTIESDEVDDFFTTRHGRQHPAAENALPWLPLDNARRDILRHVVEKYVYGGNYVGPVKEILHANPGVDKRHQVLEIGTRSGTWIQEMATEFPHVQFQSVDIAPLVPHMPRSNILFEVYDITEKLMLDDDSQDIVFINNGLELVRDYRALLREVHRVLRPGGLIHIRDLGFGLWNPNDLSRRPRENNPLACQLFDLVATATIKYGADPDAYTKIPQWLSPDSEVWKDSSQPAGFEQIQIVTKLHRPCPHAGYPCSAHMEPHMVPLIAHLYLMCIRDAVGLLCDGGLNAEQAKELTEAVVEELKNPEKCTVLKMYMMYATKSWSSSSKDSKK